jgi:23S rRNA pseudouridine1911/1915/1917 synthase
MIVFENDELLVLNKPSGMPSLPLREGERGTAVEEALARCPSVAGVGKAGLEPGLLHRLDTGTSGLLAFAKTQAAFERLRALWKSGEVEKTYRAIVERGVSPLPARIETPLGRSAKSAKRMLAILKPEHERRIRGKALPARTDIVRTESVLAGTKLDVEVRIHTGVMHQIRCHLASAGHPIAGDPVYGEAADRLWLHAWRLRLPLRSGVVLSLEAKLPDAWPEA